MTALPEPVRYADEASPKIAAIMQRDGCTQEAAEAVADRVSQRAHANAAKRRKAGGS